MLFFLHVLFITAIQLSPKGCLRGCNFLEMGGGGCLYLHL